MFRKTLAASAATLAAIAASPSISVQAQTSQPGGTPLEILLTPDRIPTQIQRTGSAVTVVRAEEIERTNPASLSEVLRQVPGLSVTQAGGPGQASTILLRGGNSGQTLVLLDGVRINDPSGPSGEFDASMIAPNIIDRIEVLRGPQSALYGSDAIGGVVNIITKKGRGAPVASLRTEAGSYGTLSTVGSITGARGPWSYTFSGLAQRIEGFSAYGYRVKRLEQARGSFEGDATTRFGGLAKLGYDPGTGFRFDAGIVATQTRAEYDAAFGNNPDTPSVGTRRFFQAHARVELDTFDNRFTHSLQVFANRNRRQFRDSNFYGAPGPEFLTVYNYTGDRFGAEYQGRLKLDTLGSLMIGARIEREKANSDTEDVRPFPSPRTRDFTGAQDTASVFGLWQLPIGERLVISLAGRHDRVSDSKAFTTGRVTAAYSLLETGTKLRTSFGTGGKAPTLFQRFSPLYGTRGLRPEESLGGDIGIDQTLFNGRFTASATVFLNRFRDLIDFQFNPAQCLPTQPFGCYVNVSRATTAGLELNGRAILVDGWLNAVGTYTYLHAKDRRNNLTLARRPQHSGRVALQFTPWEGVLIEPSVFLIGERFSSANEANRLAPYARFDIYAEYQINKTLKVHARAENVTNARYQEVFNYGTTGRAIYGGLTATW